MSFQDYKEYQKAKMLIFMHAKYWNNIMYSKLLFPLDLLLTKANFLLNKENEGI